MGIALSCLGSCAASICYSTCTPCFDWTMSQASRFSYLFLAFLIFLFAVILGTRAPELLVEYNGWTDIKLDQSCDSSFEKECIFRQLIYRASFSLFLLFLTMSGFALLSDDANKKFWIIKFIITCLVFIGFWFVESNFFSVWSEITRFVSFLWLIVQSLLILDFSFDLHDIIMKRAEEAESAHDDSRMWYVIYLILALGFLTCAIVGLIFLYHNFAGCDLGLFFVVFTTICGSLFTIASVLDSVNKGFLPPCIIFAYAVFMCWYALQSSPQDSCNPDNDKNGGGLTKSLIVTLITSLLIMLYCVMHGTRLMNLFNVEGQGMLVAYAHNDLRSSLNKAPKSERMSRDVEKSESSSTTGIEIGVAGPEKDSNERTNDEFYQESSGSWQERVFFHVLMIIFTCYVTMILTSWASSDGSPIDTSKFSSRIGAISMWLKIVSQWVFVLAVARSLQVAYQDNK